MKRKAKGKSKAAASKLRSKRIVSSKSRSKSLRSSRKPTVKTHKGTAIGRQNAKSGAEKPTFGRGSKIVRIMGHGQFTVDSRTLTKLNTIDSTLVELVSRERSDDEEFRKRLTELNEIVVKNGKPLDPHEIIKSDVILPSSDLSVDEAKKLFTGEGVIPEV